jgi:hypothetical protein
MVAAPEYPEPGKVTTTLNKNEIKIIKIKQ